MLRLRRAIGVVVVGSVALVGCGGGDGDQVGASSPTTAERSAGNGSSGGSSSGAGAGAGAAVAAISESACVQAAMAMAQATSGFSAGYSGGEDLESSIDAFTSLASAAPSEIRSDLQTVAAAYASFLTVMADANFDPSSGQVPSADALAKVQAASEGLDTAGFQEAIERVTTWFSTECGG